jgi:hypothetical protein
MNGPLDSWRMFWNWCRRKSTKSDNSPNQTMTVLAFVQSRPNSPDVVVVIFNICSSMDGRSLSARDNKIRADRRLRKSQNDLPINHFADRLAEKAQPPCGSSSCSRDSNASLDAAGTSRTGDVRCHADSIALRILVYRPSRDVRPVAGEFGYGKRWPNSGDSIGGALRIAGRSVSAASDAGRTRTQRSKDRSIRCESRSTVSELAGFRSIPKHNRHADDYSACRLSPAIQPTPGSSDRLRSLPAKAIVRLFRGHCDAVDERSDETMQVVCGIRIAPETSKVSDARGHQSDAHRKRDIVAGRLGVPGRTCHGRRTQKNAGAGSARPLPVAAAWGCQPLDILEDRTAVTFRTRLQNTGLVCGPNKSKSRFAVVGCDQRNQVSTTGRSAQSARLVLVSGSQNEEEIAESCQTNEAAGAIVSNATRTDRTVSRDRQRAGVSVAQQFAQLVERDQRDSETQRPGRCESQSPAKTAHSLERRQEVHRQLSKRLRCNVGRYLRRNRGELSAETQHGRQGFRFLERYSGTLSEDLSPVAKNCTGDGIAANLVTSSCPAPACLHFGRNEVR